MYDRKLVEKVEHILSPFYTLYIATLVVWISVRYSTKGCVRIGKMREWWNGVCV